MAGRDFGGEMRLRLADGSTLTLRTAVTIGSAGISVETVTNQDKSVSRIATPRPRTADITIQDDDQDLDALLRAPRQDIYITEDFTGVSHIFTSGMITGDPRANRTNGEITGLMIEAEGYDRRA